MSKKIQDEKKAPDVSQAYTDAKRATVKLARSLYPGCVVLAFFADTEVPERCLVVERPDAHAGIWDIKVLHESAFGSKKRDYTNGVRSLNTDKYLLLGEAKFPDDKPAVGVINIVPSQEPTLE